MMEFSMNRDILKIANQIQDWFNKFFLCLDSAKSWHDISVKGAFAYHACDGDQQLNWRKEGYKTILDVLMVSIDLITCNTHFFYKHFLERPSARSKDSAIDISYDHVYSLCYSF